MLTGLLPHANGVNGQINRGWDLDRHISPLAQILRDEVAPPIWWGVAMLAKIQLGKGLIIYKVGLTQSNQLKPALFLSVIANRCPMILLFS